MYLNVYFVLQLMLLGSTNTSSKISTDAVL